MLGILLILTSLPSPQPPPSPSLTNQSHPSLSLTVSQRRTLGTVTAAQPSRAEPRHKGIVLWSRSYPAINPQLSMSTRRPAALSPLCRSVRQSGWLLDWLPGRLVGWLAGWSKRTERKEKPIQANTLLLHHHRSSSVGDEMDLIRWEEVVVWWADTGGLVCGGVGGGHRCNLLSFFKLCCSLPDRHF